MKTALKLANFSIRKQRGYFWTTARTLTWCIINASNRRELANCSIKSFLYRTTFGNNNLQLAENDQKFASSKRKCDRHSPWKTVNMQRKKNRFVFSFSDKKSNQEVVSKMGESADFSNTIQRSGNGPKIRRLTIYWGELTGMPEF